MGATAPTARVIKARLLVQLALVQRLRLLRRLGRGWGWRLAAGADGAAGRMGRWWLGLRLLRRRLGRWRLGRRLWLRLGRLAGCAIGNYYPGYYGDYYGPYYERPVRMRCGASAARRAPARELRI